MKVVTGVEGWKKKVGMIRIGEHGVEVRDANNSGERDTGCLDPGVYEAALSVFRVLWTGIAVAREGAPVVHRVRAVVGTTGVGAVGSRRDGAKDDANTSGVGLGDHVLKRGFYFRCFAAGVEAEIHLAEIDDHCLYTGLMQNVAIDTINPG